MHQSKDMVSIFKSNRFEVWVFFNMLMLINGNTLVQYPDGERLTSNQHFLLGVEYEAFQLNPNGHITYHFGRTLNWHRRSFACTYEAGPPFLRWEWITSEHKRLKCLKKDGAIRHSHGNHLYCWANKYRLTIRPNVKVRVYTITARDSYIIPRISAT